MSITCCPPGRSRHFLFVMFGQQLVHACCWAGAVSLPKDEMGWYAHSYIHACIQTCFSTGAPSLEINKAGSICDAQGHGHAEKPRCHAREAPLARCITPRLCAVRAARRARLASRETSRSAIFFLFFFQFLGGFCITRPHSRVPSYLPPMRGLVPIVTRRCRPGGTR